MTLKKTLDIKTLLSALLVSVLTILLLKIIAQATGEHPTLGTQLLEINRDLTQSANAVTSVVTYFRGLDTLGEVTILFLSIFGIGIGINRSEQVRTILHFDNPLLKIGAKVLFPIIILFGAYVILHGHLSPGGGFQGGVVIASAFLLMFLAEGDVYNLDHRIMTLFEALSGAGFVLVGILGCVAGGLFLGNTLPLGTLGSLFSGGVLPVIYLFVGLKVASEITLLIEYFIRTRDARDV